MLILDFGEKKRKRTPVSKKEWEARKKQSGNKCVACGRTEKAVGILRKAHIKAYSKGGTQYAPLCSNCHYKYDHGLLSATALKKLGLTKADYARFRPKKQKRKKHDFII